MGRSGRRLYELMAGYWPTADEDRSVSAYIAEYVRLWREKPRIVFSRSLQKVDWNSQLVTAVIPQEIVALKRESETDLSVGGATLAATLVQFGLVDEFCLFVNPVVLGRGTPYLPRLDNRLQLRLLESRGFESGVTFLRYERT